MFLKNSTVVVSVLVVSVLASASLALAQGAATSVSKPKTPTKLTCVFGAPGFNTSDPDMMLVFIGTEVSLDGKAALTTKGKVFATGPEPIDMAVTPKKAAAGSTYSFSGKTADAADAPALEFSVEVTNKPFTGKIAGVSKDAAKALIAAKITLADSPETSIDGGCVLE